MACHEKYQLVEEEKKENETKEKPQQGKCSKWIYNDIDWEKEKIVGIVRIIVSWEKANVCIAKS